MQKVSDECRKEGLDDDCAAILNPAYPPLDKQVAWVQHLHDDHLKEILARGDHPADGTAMIAGILASLKRLPELERDLAMARAQNFDHENAISALQQELKEAWEAYGRERRLKLAAYQQNAAPQAGKPIRTGNAEPLPADAAPFECICPNCGIRHGSRLPKPGEAPYHETA